jgi:hypothetical protein
VEIILGVLVMIAVLLGVTLHIRAKHYDGTLTVSENEYGSVLTLNVDPGDLVDKDHVKLKIITPAENRIENKD